MAPMRVRAAVTSAPHSLLWWSSTTVLVGSRRAAAARAALCSCTTRGQSSGGPIGAGAGAGGARAAVAAGACGGGAAKSASHPPPSDTGACFGGMAVGTGCAAGVCSGLSMMSSSPAGRGTGSSSLLGRAGGGASDRGRSADGSGGAAGAVGVTASRTQVGTNDGPSRRESSTPPSGVLRLAAAALANIFCVDARRRADNAARWVVAGVDGGAIGAGARGGPRAPAPIVGPPTPRRWTVGAGWPRLCCRCAHIVPGTQRATRVWRGQPSRSSRTAAI